MRSNLVLVALAVMVTGCASEPFKCGLPGGPQCLSLPQAYALATKPDVGGDRAQGVNGGFYPTSRETTAVINLPAHSSMGAEYDQDRISELRRKNPSLDDEGIYKLYDSVLAWRTGKRGGSRNATYAAFAHGTKPLADVDGFHPNGKPKTVGNNYDSDLLYYEQTPSGIPSGWVPARIVRVWMPAFIDRNGNRNYSSYFDVKLSDGHYTEGLLERDIMAERAAVISLEEAHDDDAYERYDRYTSLSHIIWERDVYGNVTVTAVNRKNPSARRVTRYPGGVGAPLPSGYKYSPGDPVPTEDDAIMKDNVRVNSARAQSAPTPTIRVQPPVAPVGQ